MRVPLRACSRQRPRHPAALDAGLTRQITQARQRLDAAAGHARGGFDALAIAIPLLIVLAGVLVLIGLERRIAEYQ